MSPQILNTHHKIIDNMIIKWEKFQKSSRSATQCHKCQRYGHSAVNCGHKYRCIKCVETHLPGNCKRTNRERSAKCVNCQGDHPANSRTCMFYLDYITKIENLRRPKLPRPKKFESTPAPWFSSQSTNLPPVNPSQRLEYFHNEDFPQLTQSLSQKQKDPICNLNTVKNINLSNNVSKFNKFCKLSNEFCSIPNIREQ
jgi:hypothetical protein